ncbi:MAG TPA: hypothetical protein VJ386_09780 [Candidatus Deferrimicrobiaceae bacterium]|jgi:hypothetical protein|nr:hypothetical protein [Candidatus Deferrimicrobiaceae bacterium]
MVHEGRSSGGESASGEYRRGNRRLELHFRWSLGLVTYHVGDISLSHEEYIRAVHGVVKIQGKNAYPGFSQDPLDGFRHLREDLERFGDVVVKGSDDEFRSLKAWVDAHPKGKGMKGLVP